MKQLTFIIFVIIVIIQWAVPGSMIWQREKILTSGKVFNFRTEPVDPSDPFKGRYIRLNFKEAQFRSISPDSTLESYGDVYVLLEKDNEGFAKVKNVVKQKPAAVVDFVEASINYISKENKDTSVIFINYPFDEFYMDEFKAPKAETAYRQSNIDTAQKTYAAISVLNGEAVIKDVMINNKPIREVIKEMDKH